MQTSPAASRGLGGRPAAADVAGAVEAVVDNVGRVLRGKREAVQLAVCCLLAEGHLLIEDLPGTGKTTLARALAASLGCSWSRVQFTPDLLPTDVLGVSVYRASAEAFEFRPGSVFANLVLADEINRASPRTQSALLEAMQERQVTVDGTTRPLPSPFMVVATQNPADHEGTYPLPESQLDRFLMRISLGYPERDAAMDILDAAGDGEAARSDLPAVVDAAEVAALAAAVRAVHVAPAVKHYLLDLADATRRHPLLAAGASPRAVVGLQAAARARAAADARSFVSPDDVKAVAGPVLTHRLAVRPQALVEGVDGGDIIGRLLDAVPVPTSVAGPRSAGGGGR